MTGLRATLEYEVGAGPCLRGVLEIRGMLEIENCRINRPRSSTRWARSLSREGQCVCVCVCVCVPQRDRERQTIDFYILTMTRIRTRWVRFLSHNDHKITDHDDVLVCVRTFVLACVGACGDMQAQARTHASACGDRAMCWRG